MHTDQEIEVRFLEVDPTEIKQKLIKLEATDLGEQTIHEIIFYDHARSWGKYKFVRLRKTKDGSILTWKHQHTDSADGTIEVETKVEDFDAMKRILEELGLEAFRTQEKHRHTFTLGKVTFDLDQWPLIPPYLEIEGPSEASLREAATSLGLSWEDACFQAAGGVIKNIYGIDVISMRTFTFAEQK